MGSSTTLWRDARTLFAEGTVAGLTDGELLDRFAQRSAALSEVAFTALVARHGPLVYGVCRRILSSPHDVDDAFQATFLVLVRRAASVRVRDSLAPWLYGVSYRIATRARIAASRRRMRETSDIGRLPACTERVPADRDLRSVIDDELARLPERYRSPVVLCYLEGLSHEEASRRLRCPVGTIKSRLARGREQLRGGLTRRGLAPSAGSFAFTLSVGPIRATLPGDLSRVTVRAAVSHVMGRGAAQGAFPASATALTEGVLRAMGWTNLKLTAAFLLVLCAAGTGSLALRSSRADDPRGRAADSSGSSPDPATRIELPRKTPETLAIERALNVPVTLDFDDAMLCDAVGLIANDSKLNIVLDPKAMEARGVTLESRVNFKATNIKLKAALKLLLMPLGLVYQVEDDVVMIRSSATGRRRQINANERLATYSVYVSRPRLEGLAAIDASRLQEQVIREIERTTSCKTVGSPEEADLIVIPTRRLLTRGRAAP